MMTLLSTPETLTNPAQAVRYLVELVSVETELNAQGISVARHFRTLTLDVCVIEPTRDAIASLLAARGYLKHYRIVNHWIPEDCDRF